MGRLTISGKLRDLRVLLATSVLWYAFLCNFGLLIFKTATSVSTSSFNSGLLYDGLFCSAHSVIHRIAGPISSSLVEELGSVDDDEGNYSVIVVF